MGVEYHLPLPTTTTAGMCRHITTTKTTGALWQDLAGSAPKEVTRRTCTTPSPRLSATSSASIRLILWSTASLIFLVIRSGWPLQASLGGLRIVVPCDTGPDFPCVAHPWPTERLKLMRKP
ncbi:hypothetical protein PV11_00343 [Exophiala sideris]|uniref:Uncharacterized protein n=1 Tax=Exophiala sideris TaxID=1016849 RepID=A0A0D1W7B5_9EURO|nr:hypothetical protein PV11_00343 [Exophiala sideris]